MSLMHLLPCEVCRATLLRRHNVVMQVYGERRRALMASDLSPQLVEYAERTVDDILEVDQSQITTQLKPH